MGMRFLHGILAFSIVLGLGLFPAGRVYASPWFTTYGGGVLSGNADTDSIKSTQSSVTFPAGDVFKNSLIQPGVVNPTLIDGKYSFSYGGILSSGDYEVYKANGTTDTIDAYAKNLGAFDGALPDYQRFADAAVDLSTVCTNCNKLLTDCTIPPGIYKDTLNCINNALDSLTGKTYGTSISSDGLVVLVQNDPGSSNSLLIKNEVKSGDTDKRLVIVTSRPIKIQSGVGNEAVTTQAGYLAQAADIQAMLITTSTDDPAIEVESGSKKLKIEGPIISKGKVRFRRDAGTAWPGVLVQYNPFYITELAKLDASLAIFGSSSVRWVYE